MRTSLFKGILFFVCWVGSTAGAQTGLTFLTLQDFKIASFPAPPVEGSLAASEDLRHVLEIQNSRTKEECARALSEVSLGLSSIFGPTYGPLTKQEVAQVAGFYRLLFSDADYFVNGIKARFKRPRPFQRSSEVHPCVPPHNSFSYPSGHATISRLAALALGQVFPAKAEALLKRADQVALDRVIGGVHHLIDIEAGQKLADQLFLQLQEKVKFQNVVQELRVSVNKGAK